MRPIAILVTTLAIAGAGLALSTAAPTLGVKEREAVSLKVRCLTADTVDTPPDGAYTLGLSDGRSGSVKFGALWPDAGSTASVTIAATARPPQPGATHTIRLDATVELPDGSRLRSSRDMAFDDSTTALFELARRDERSLTVAVEAETVQETVVFSRPTAGAPVVFHVDVQWLQEGRSESLETNRLSTFVGEEVSYSFRLGEMDVAEALELRLTPIAVFDDVVQLRAEVSGSVPREGAPEVLSRTESWLLSRGESSTLDVTSGEPKTGFRFVVTPRF